MIPSNPQTEDEIIDSFMKAKDHPDIWLMEWRQRLGILKRRWLDLPKMEGDAEYFFRLIMQHIEMAEGLSFQLSKEMRNQCTPPKS